MKILSIETSADETGVAILDISGSPAKPDIDVCASALASQIDVHKEYGGIYPMLAKREHQKNLPLLLDKVLKEADQDPEAPKLDMIAVTVGPGLEPALWTGIEFAEALGEKWKKPVVPVNHMEGHIYSVLFEGKDEVALPSLALLVSGGHTELVLIKGFGEYQILGRTLDDAVGEAYDKVARMLGLPYPGGPEISRLADRARASSRSISIKLPIPMINSKDFNFSFSGLKTAVLYAVKKAGREDQEFKEDMALAFEEAAVKSLIHKTSKALEAHSEVRSLIVGGGVSANAHLSRSLQALASELGIELHEPRKALTGDNAVMIGIAAYIKAQAHPEILKEKRKLIAQGNLSIS